MEKPVRKLHRLPGYDYGQNGYYFVTICTKNHRKLLCSVGNAVPGVPHPVTSTEVGDLVLRAWDRMSEIDPQIHTDYFCMMPNHVHGIIVIDGIDDGTVQTERRGRRSLPEIVRAFKSVTTREYNRIVPKEERNTLWQGSYYDEVIRNEAHLAVIRNYIETNPARWSEDEYFTP